MGIKVLYVVNQTSEVVERLLVKFVFFCSVSFCCFNKVFKDNILCIFEKFIAFLKTRFVEVLSAEVITIRYSFFVISQFV